MDTPVIEVSDLFPLLQDTPAQGRASFPCLDGSVNLQTSSVIVGQLGNSSVSGFMALCLVWKLTKRNYERWLSQMDLSDIFLCTHADVESRPRSTNTVTPTHPSLILCCLSMAHVGQMHREQMASEVKDAAN